MAWVTSRTIAFAAVTIICQNVLLVNSQRPPNKGPPQNQVQRRQEQPRQQQTGPQQLRQDPAAPPQVLMHPPQELVHPPQVLMHPPQQPRQDPAAPPQNQWQDPDIKRREEEELAAKKKEEKRLENVKILGDAYAAGEARRLAVAEEKKRLKEGKPLLAQETEKLKEETDPNLDILQMLAKLESFKQQQTTQTTAGLLPNVQLHVVPTAGPQTYEVADNFPVVDAYPAAAPQNQWQGPAAIPQNLWQGQAQTGQQQWQDPAVQPQDQWQTGQQNFQIEGLDLGSLLKDYKQQLQQEPAVYAGQQNNAGLQNNYAAAAVDPYASLAVDPFAGLQNNYAAAAINSYADPYASLWNNDKQANNNAAVDNYQNNYAAAAINSYADPYASLWNNENAAAAVDNYQNNYAAAAINSYADPYASLWNNDNAAAAVDNYQNNYAAAAINSYADPYASLWNNDNSKQQETPKQTQPPAYKVPDDQYNAPQQAGSVQTVDLSYIKELLQKNMGLFGESPKTQPLDSYPVPSQDYQFPQAGGSDDSNVWSNAGNLPISRVQYPELNREYDTGPSPYEQYPMVNPVNPFSDDNMGNNDYEPIEPEPGGYVPEDVSGEVPYSGEDYSNSNLQQQQKAADDFAKKRRTKLSKINKQETSEETSGSAKPTIEKAAVLPTIIFLLYQLV